MNRPIHARVDSAPRMGKAEFTKQVITSKLWRKFRKQFKEYENMSDRELMNYWDDISETIRHEWVNNPLGVKLGSYAGELKVQYLPHKKKYTDQKASAEIGERVNHLNIITKGKAAVVKWERRWAVKFNKVLQYYGFSAVSKVKTMANKYILQNPEKIRVSRNTLGGKSAWRMKIKAFDNGK